MWASLNFWICRTPPWWCAWMRARHLHIRNRYTPAPENRSVRIAYRHENSYTRRAAPWSFVSHSVSRRAGRKRIVPHSASRRSRLRRSVITGRPTIVLQMILALVIVKIRSSMWQSNSEIQPPPREWKQMYNVDMYRVCISHDGKSLVYAGIIVDARVFIR